MDNRLLLAILIFSVGMPIPIKHTGISEAFIPVITLSFFCFFIDRWAFRVQAQI